MHMYFLPPISMLRIAAPLLEGINEFETRWIGWAGVNVPDEIGQKSLTLALAEKVSIIQSCTILFISV